MNVKTEKNKYHVAFERNHSNVQRIVTICRIFLLMPAGDPILMGVGKTVLGLKDKDDSLLGFKFALARALSAANLGKGARTSFWREFRKRHVRLPWLRWLERSHKSTLHHDTTCQYKVKARGGGRDWCVKHKTHCSVGEAVLPRSRVEKDRQLGELYGYRKRVTPPTAPCSEKFNNFGNFGSFGDYPYRRVAEKKQSQDRIINTVSHADSVEKALRENADAVRNIICNRKPVDTGQLKEWVSGHWPDALNLKLQELIAEADRTSLEDRILAYTGVTKVCDEYVVDPEKFKSGFKVGQVVTYKDALHRVRDISGPMLTIHRISGWSFLGKDKQVMDWEVQKRRSWLGQLWYAVTATLEEADATGQDAVPGRGLYKMIDRNYCGSCHGNTIWIPPVHSGARSCSTTKCKYCDQEYWYTNETRTAKRI